MFPEYSSSSRLSNCFNPHSPAGFQNKVKLLRIPISAVTDQHAPPDLCLDQRLGVEQWLQAVKLPFFEEHQQMPLAAPERQQGLLVGKPGRLVALLAAKLQFVDLAGDQYPL